MIPWPTEPSTRPPSFRPPTASTTIPPISPRSQPPDDTGSGTSAIASTISTLVVVLITVIAPLIICVCSICNTSSHPLNRRRRQQSRHQLPTHQLSHINPQQQAVEPQEEIYPEGVLTGSSPPPYSAAVNFPSPKLGDRDDDAKDPPPYPG